MKFENWFTSFVYVYGDYLKSQNLNTFVLLGPVVQSSISINPELTQTYQNKTYIEVNPELALLGL